MGCAFAACLERKQKREKECGVTASFDASRTSFAREGSFRLPGPPASASRPSGARPPQDRKKGRGHSGISTSQHPGLRSQAKAAPLQSPAQNKQGFRMQLAVDDG